MRLRVVKNDRCRLDRQLNLLFRSGLDVGLVAVNGPAGAKGHQDRVGAIFERSVGIVYQIKDTTKVQRDGVIGTPAGQGFGGRVKQLDDTIGANDGDAVRDGVDDDLRLDGVNTTVLTLAPGLFG